MEKKGYVIFNQRLAGYLMFKGFVLMNIGKADSGSGKNVFVFNKSDELFKRIQEYKEQFQK